MPKQHKMAESDATSTDAFSVSGRSNDSDYVPSDESERTQGKKKFKTCIFCLDGNINP